MPRQSKIGKFQSLLGKLQFSMANGGDFDDQLSIIGSLAWHNYPGTLECLQGYSDKVLSDPESRAEMWLKALHNSVEGSELESYAEEAMVEEIQSLETPESRAKMWAFVYNEIFRSSGQEERAAQAIENCTVEIQSLESPQERAQLWYDDIYRPAENHSDLKRHAIEMYAGEISLHEAPLEQAEIWRNVYINPTPTYAFRKQLTEELFDNIRALENPEQQAEMWRTVLETPTLHDDQKGQAKRELTKLRRDSKEQAQPPTATAEEFIHSLT